MKERSVNILNGLDSGDVQACFWSWSGTLHEAAGSKFSITRLTASPLESHHRGYYALSHEANTMLQQQICSPASPSSPSFPRQQHNWNHSSAMTPKHLQPARRLILLTSFSLPTLEYIDSPMDWVFAPQHDRGLVCPSLNGCCPDLNTWRHVSPCEHPKATENPKECYQRKEWACCRADVHRCEVASRTITDIVGKYLHMHDGVPERQRPRRMALGHRREVLGHGERSSKLWAAAAERVRRLLKPLDHHVRTRRRIMGLHARRR